MQAWEYLSVMADMGDHDTWRPFKINGHELANWSHGQSLDDYMTELGNQGWELVNAIYSGPDTASFIGRLFFKRPTSC